MHRFTLQAVMLSTLLTLPTAARADRMYNILNNPDIQNGWTLSGTITTDGTMGQIQASNILSWTWTITSGAGSFTVSSTDPGAAVIYGAITATRTGLLVPFYGDGIGLTTQGAGLEWVTIGGTQLSTYAEVTSAPWGDNGWDSLIGPPADGSSAWLIASNPVAVPEPSPVSIAGFGAVCGCVYVMGQKRRARRTATTGA